MIDEKRHVYGGVFIARLDYIQEKYGSSGVEKILEKMKDMGYDGPRSIKDFQLGSKYPFEYLMMLFKAIESTYGKDVLLACSRAAAHKTGIVGFFVRWAGSPELILRKAGEYWGKFYDFGRLEGELLEDGHGIARGYYLSPDPLFCEVLTHYFRGIFDNIRVKNLEVKHTKCVHRGDDHCEWEFRWE